MKKLILALVMVLALAGVVYAGEEQKSKFSGNVDHLYFYEKDTNWDPVEEGSWGKMQYTPNGSEFNFVFNGHQMEADTPYTLIYYPDPWPGNGLICLGNGSSNGGGNVHIAGVTNSGDLPASYDVNFNWDVRGTYKWNVFDTYFHDITIDTQNADGKFSGYGGYPAGGPYTTGELITGQVDGNNFTMTTVYDGWSYSVTVNGTIQPDGTISGTNPWVWSLEEGYATPDGGAKIWLVLSDDVDCDEQKMTAWNQSEYLFENNLITFDQTE